MAEWDGHVHPTFLRSVFVPKQKPGTPESGGGGARVPF